MADVCPDCGRELRGFPVTADESVCYLAWTGFGLRSCKEATVARLRSQLALALACVEAADKMREWPDRFQAYDAARAAFAGVPVAADLEESVARVFRYTPGNPDSARQETPSKPAKRTNQRSK